MKKQKKRLRLKKSKQLVIKNARHLETAEGFELHLVRGRVIKESEMVYISDDEPLDGGDWYYYPRFYLKNDPSFIVTFIDGRGCRTLYEIRYGKECFNPEDPEVHSFVVESKPQPKEVDVPAEKVERPWFLDAKVLMGTYGNKLND